MSQKKKYTENVSSFLNLVISTQSKLAEAAFDVNAFMELVVFQMQKLTPAKSVVVELVEGRNMVYRAAIGQVKQFLGLKLPIEGSISGLCVRTNKILCSYDTETDPRVNREATRKVGARSLVVAPLIYQDKAVGVLKIMSDVPNGFDETHNKTLQLMANFIASGLAHQILYEKNRKLLTSKTLALKELRLAQNELKHLATHDSLTGLFNRRCFMEHLLTALSRITRTKKLAALMYLDIDHFKSINDTLGHGLGDDLLKAFSSRLKKCIRAHNVFARFGGDEFVLLVEDLDSQENAIKVACKIITATKKEFVLKGNKLSITTSIGITFFKDNTIKPENLIKEADYALYLAKSAGRNTFRIFELSSTD